MKVTAMNFNGEGNGNGKNPIGIGPPDYDLEEQKRVGGGFRNQNIM